MVVFYCLRFFHPILLNKSVAFCTLKKKFRDIKKAWQNPILKACFAWRMYSVIIIIVFWPNYRNIISFQFQAGFS